MNCTAALSLYLSRPSISITKSLPPQLYLFVPLPLLVFLSLVCVSPAVLETAGWFFPRLVEMSDRQNDLQLSATCSLQEVPQVCSLKWSDELIQHSDASTKSVRAHGELYSITEQEDTNLDHTRCGLREKTLHCFDKLELNQITLKLSGNYQCQKM